jgi:hypothetical protein
MYRKDLLWLLLIPAVAAPLLNWRMEQKVDDDYTGCGSNLKCIATACEMYSTDNAGRYPHSLDKLVPLYLKEMRVCPGADPASHRYAYECAAIPDIFSICCQGLNHQPKIQVANYPQYLNGHGVHER